MANSSVTLNPGVDGAQVASDSIAGRQFQQIKPAYGPEGTAKIVDVPAPMPVEVVGGATCLRTYTKRLTSDGAGGGTTTILSDYSVTSQKFYFVNPGATDIFVVDELVLAVSDVGTFTTATYGVLAALTNGISVYTNDGTTDSSLVGGLTIKTNGDLFTHFTDVSYVTLGGGDPIIVARWDLRSSFGGIRLGNGHSINLLANDNFTGLTIHHALIRGYSQAV